MLKQLVKHFLLILPLQKTILFESAPDFSDNTQAVYEEMVNRGLNRKYKFVWLVSDIKSNRTHKKNTKVIKLNSFLSVFYRYTAKCIICCNRFITTERKNQFRFYLGHGNPLKNTKGYYEIPTDFQYILSSSDGMKRIRSEFYGISEDRLIVLGYPRNDAFSKDRIDLHSLFERRFSKIIVWYPTVRQFKGGRLTGSNHALPVVWNEDKALKLNKCAKENDVLIVLKPHFAQDISFLKKLVLSNIIFIDDSFFKKNSLTSYSFVNSCDALLTDFSSIYYDYTLCDKPIGLIWEDYEEYKKSPGFAIDMDYMMKGGFKIYNISDFEKFIIDVANDRDELKEQRREIRDFANYSLDGLNAKRVCDFIVEQAKLKL